MISSVGLLGVDAEDEEVGIFYKAWKIFHGQLARDKPLLQSWHPSPRLIHLLQLISLMSRWRGPCKEGVTQELLLLKLLPITLEDRKMQVRDVMSTRPKILPADATIREAAIQMRDCESGIMPIAKNEKLIGMLTDRDITIRAVADGISPEDKVTDILATEVLYCFEDDDITAVLKNMHEQQVQRLIVLNNRDSKDLVGIVSVADIADKCKDDITSAKAIAECCSHYH